MAHLITDEEKADALLYHLKFMQYTWARKDPLLVGVHTETICREIDLAIDKFKKGESSFLIIKVPFRHGKSDIISRYLPLHFLTIFPDFEVMLVTYAAALAQKFSRFGRNLSRSAAYKKLVTGFRKPRVLSTETSSVEHWALQGFLGSVTASGLTSGITGNGYHLGILDDFCGSRADAESLTMRNDAWDAFSQDFMTRRAPVSITIILATPWHVDDVIGRAQKMMKEDPKFPRFKVISFPAYDKKYLELKRPIKSAYLFPERFPEEWYKTQEATLGTYGTASLLQCNPTLREGSLLKTNKIHKVPIDAYPTDIQYIRMWDLAHTAKQRTKDDPDWTSGTLIGVQDVDGIKKLWIKDVRRIKDSAPKRDDLIDQLAMDDGERVKPVIETSVDAKDAYFTLQKRLEGRRSIDEIQPGKDKVIRASSVEAIFEAGNVFVPIGAEWYQDWLDEVMAFPFGKHDDQVDNITAAYEYLANPSWSFF